MASITTTREGQRIYFGGDTYAARDRIKAMGGHWDADRRAWWVGAKKEAEATALVAELNAAGASGQPKTENPDDIRLVGKAQYKGRTYYVRAISQDGTRARLTTLDAKLDFWAGVGSAADQAQIVKRYQPRERTYGYGRYTSTEYTTLGSIRRFIEEQRGARDRGDPVCAECGRAGGELVADLEDGALKHPRCCDIPPC